MEHRLGREDPPVRRRLDGGDGDSIQLNTIETNERFRWEYEPGSDLFVVYTDGRDTSDRRLAELVNRGIAAKFSHLFRF